MLTLAFPTVFDFYLQHYVNISGFYWVMLHVDLPHTIQKPLKSNWYRVIVRKSRLSLRCSFFIMCESSSEHVWQNTYSYFPDLGDILYKYLAFLLYASFLFPSVNHPSSPHISLDWILYNELNTIRTRHSKIIKYLLQRKNSFFG